MLGGLGLIRDIKQKGRDIKIKSLHRRCTGKGLELKGQYSIPFRPRETSEIRRLFYNFLRFNTDRIGGEYMFAPRLLCPCNGPQWVYSELCRDDQINANKDVTKVVTKLMLDQGIPYWIPYCTGGENPIIGLNVDGEFYISPEDVRAWLIKQGDQYRRLVENRGETLVLNN
ncbi:MAG: hypothetical protein EP297_13240 [Gammaproteobacteria bacterium]|nr:MAG: hypothetical protein EP297_13240 [Gammaproteobacteria bacterium]